MKIAILSRNPNLYSTTRLVEAGKKRGHEIVVLDHLKCVLVIEKNKPHIYYRGEKVNGVNAVIPRIGASATFYGAAVVRQFEMMKIFTAVESQALVRSRDKLRSLQLLARAGIGMPKTAFASTTKYVDNLIEQAGGAPVVVKLLEGTQGIGVILAETHASAKSVIEAFLGVKVNLLVQEFVKEAKGIDIRVFVVDGQIVGSMKRQGVKVVICETWDDVRLSEYVANQAGAKMVILPDHVSGIPGVDTYAKLFQYDTQKLIETARAAGVQPK